MPTNVSDINRKPVIVAGEGVSPVKRTEGMPTFGTMRPGVSFKNVVTLNAIHKREEGKSVQTESPSEMGSVNTNLKFGTLNASLPPRVQSAPPTLEEQEMISKAIDAKALEPTPEGEETQFKKTSPPQPMLPFKQVENVRPFVPAPQSYYPYHVNVGGGRKGGASGYYANYPPSMSYYMPSHYPHMYSPQSMYRPPPPPVINADATVPAQPRQTKKIQIVDPTTMKEVDLADVPKIKKMIPETPSTETESLYSNVVTPTEFISPRKPVILVDPTSNEEVDLSSLANSTQKLAKILDEIDEDGLFDDHDDPIVEDRTSESDKSISDDENELANAEFPVILTRSIKVNYPDGAVSFVFPDEGCPLRYSAEFLLQFAPHCRGEAKDIASVAFPKDIPTEKLERRSHRSNGRSGRHADRHHGRRTVHYSAEDTVLTNRAADAWKRASAMVMDEDKVLLREVKLLLNKLTEEKFETLTNQILRIGVLKTGMTTGVIDMLFDKAVEEPRYAPLYAQLCCRIWNFEIEGLKRELPAEDHTALAKKSVFRRSLVTKCQVEYDTKRAYSKQRLEKLMAKQVAASNSDEEQAEPEAEASQEVSTPTSNTDSAVRYSGELTEDDYAMIKLKRRVLGNMRFIGELFNAGLIPAKIMHSVIQELLADITNPEEEEVESVCRLLPTVGAALDNAETAFLWSKYVERLKVLSSCTKLSTRVRFMVLDVLELRGTGWRKIKPFPSQSATTIGGSSGAKSTDKRSLDSNRRESSSATAGRHSRDAVRYVTARSQDVRFEKGSSRDSDEFKTTVTRIQARNSINRPEEISRPVSSTSKASQASQESLNRYKALEHEEDQRRQQPSDGHESTSPIEIGVIIDEQQAGKLIAIFDEALQQKNFEDISIGLDEFPIQCRSMALQPLILHGMDKGRKHVEALNSIILPDFVSKGLLNSIVIISSLRGAFELLDDLAVDIPNAFDYAGSISAFFIDANLLSLSSLVENVLDSVLERSPISVAKTVMYALYSSKQSVSAKQTMVENASDPLNKCLFVDHVRAIIKPTIEKLALEQVVRID